MLRVPHRGPRPAGRHLADDASGYPIDGTFPGQDHLHGAYNPAAHTGSMHTTATASWPSSVGATYAGGDCKNCHDVHGTANAYDELRTESTAGVPGVYTFSSANFGFCFNCHDADGPGADDIKQYYPTDRRRHGGPVGLRRGLLARHALRPPHAVCGNLPAGSALPCYDCHNPHGTGTGGAYGLMVTVQTAAGHHHHGRRRRRRDRP